ncbi:MAG: T9SS type A sorting domain-containing protein [Bacteroidia bacterium]
MKIFYLLLAVTLCFFIAANLQAQTAQRCGTDAYNTMLSNKFPQTAATHQALEAQYYNFITNSREKSTSSGVKYVIPVVVHVIHRTQDAAPGTLSNVSDQRIAEQIAILNQDYRNFGGTNFSSDAVDTEIEFQLAKRDPDGNCTNGIVRVPSNLSTGVLWQNYAADSTLKSLSHWPRERYLNMYVVYSISPSAFGYATFPWHIGTAALDTIDGVVIRYDAFGLSGNGEVALGRTATHEVGHWLGLLHTFQDDSIPNGVGGYNYFYCRNDSCLKQNDKVCDTPPTNGPTDIALSCAATPNTCAADDDDLTLNNPFRPAGNGGAGDQFDMISNYMDYSSDSCMNKFTPGQLDRIDFYINNARSSVWDPNNQTQTGLRGLLHDFDSVQVTTGLNGRVNVMCEYNGKLIIAGDFTSADGLACSRIVAWNGSSYENLNNVPQFFNGVTSMAVYKGKLYVGGMFTIQDQFNYLASYDGTQWDSLCTNADYRSTGGPVRSLWVYKNLLYVGGDFGWVDGLQLNASNIATWDGAAWDTVSSGLSGNSSSCYAMTVWNDKLVLGGRFTAAGGVACDKVAFWDGSTFTSANTGANVVSSGRLNCLYSYEGKLYTGGDYTSVGGNILPGLTEYDGSDWSDNSSSFLGFNRFALEQFNGYLWVGGHIMDLGEDEQHIYIYDASLDGYYTVSGEHRGFDSPVNCMTQFNNELYIGGDFTELEGMNGNPNKTFNYITKVHTVCIDPIPVGIDNAEKNRVFKLYPNPVSNMLTIENVKEGLRVFNVIGEEVLAMKINSGDNKVQLNVSGFASGIYFIQSGNQTEKFVKQ